MTSTIAANYANENEKRSENDSKDGAVSERRRGRFVVRGHGRRLISHSALHRPSVVLFGVTTRRTFFSVRGKDGTARLAQEAAPIPGSFVWLDPTPSIPSVIMVTRTQTLIVMDASHHGSLVARVVFLSASSVVTISAAVASNVLARSASIEGMSIFICGTLALSSRHTAMFPFSVTLVQPTPLVTFIVESAV